MTTQFSVYPDLALACRLVGLDKLPLTIQEDKDAWEDLEYWAATMDWPDDVTPPDQITIPKYDLMRLMRLVTAAHLYITREMHRNNERID